MSPRWSILSGPRDGPLKHIQMEDASIREMIVRRRPESGCEFSLPGRRHQTRHSQKPIPGMPPLPGGLRPQLAGTQVVASSQGDNIITVTKDNDVHTHTLVVTRVSAQTLMNDAILSGLTLNGTDTDTFASATTEYTGYVASDVTGTMVAQTPTESNAHMLVLPGDTDSTVQGHQAEPT